MECAARPAGRSDPRRLSRHPCSSAVVIHLLAIKTRRDGMALRAARRHWLLAVASVILPGPRGTSLPAGGSAVRTVGVRPGVAMVADATVPDSTRCNVRTVRA